MKKVFFATTLMALTAGASMAADYQCKVFQNEKPVFKTKFYGASDKGECLKKVKTNIRSLVGQYGGGSYQVTWGHQDGFQAVIKKYRAKGPAKSPERVPASVGPSRDPAAIAKVKKQVADEYENIQTYKSEIEYHKSNIAKLNKQLGSM